MMTRVKSEYDFIIFGGNIAGASLAHFLSAKGFSVLVLEKLHFGEFNKKPCGDAVDEKVFEVVGLRGFVREGWIISYINSCRIYNSVGEYVEVEGDGFIIDRNEFVKGFYEISNNVDFVGGIEEFEVNLDENKVRFCVNGNAFTVKFNYYVFDCTGIRRAIYSKLFGKKLVFEVLPTFRGIFKAKKYTDWNTINLYVDFDISPGAYYWIFPREKRGELNVGLGMVLSPMSRNIIQNFKKILEKHKDIIGNAIEVRGWGVPTTIFPYVISTKKFVLHGDAGNVVCPITGGGISWIIKTSRMISDVLSEDIDNFHRINIEYFKRIGREQIMFDLIKYLFRKMSQTEIDEFIRSKIIRDIFDYRDGKRILSILKFVAKSLYCESCRNFLMGISKINRDLRKLGEYPSDLKDIRRFIEKLRKIYERNVGFYPYSMEIPF